MDGHTVGGHTHTHTPGLSGRYACRERHTKSKVVKITSPVNSDASEFLIRKINYVLTDRTGDNIIKRKRVFRSARNITAQQIVQYDNILFRIIFNRRIIIL